MTYETVIGLTMLGVMIAAIFLGFPISFTLLFLAFVFGWWGLGDIVFNLGYFQAIGLMKESLLAAVPLFIDGRLAAGAITAGGTLGILIPPSVMLIVMGPVLGVSVADLYAAAIVPGFMLAGMYVIYVAVRSYFNPKLGPPLPKELRAPSVWFALRGFVVGVVPLAGLVAATLGSILAGMATPTEAAGMGAAGALVLAAAYRKLTWGGFQRALLQSLATSSMVLVLALTSNIFGAVFARLGAADWITEWLLALPLPPALMLALVTVLIFLLGWPFEWPAVILVFLPIFYPVVNELGVDLVWFGALVAVTLQTAYLSPPVCPPITSRHVRVHGDPDRRHRADLPLSDHRDLASGPALRQRRAGGQRTCAHRRLLLYLWRFLRADVQPLAGQRAQAIIRSKEKRPPSLHPRALKPSRL